MARDSAVSKAIYTRHIRLYRLLNDAWIFTELLRPDLKERAQKLRTSKSKVKRPYLVPKRDGTVISQRRDEDIGLIFNAQHERGVFETNIVSLVSRTEAFIQDCLAIVATAYPKKLSVLADKGGIPLDLFLEHEEREDVIRRFVAMKCEGLMFGKPSEYLEKAAKVLTIELDADLVKAFIEIKASRDIIIHNSGRINKLYIEKVGDQRRGEDGEELVIDRDYFRHIIVTLKKLSGEIQSKTEQKYK
ncbi:hypothetical protein HFO89_07070 [Rhizobium leguminosarum]|uniref:hypothetical protein n=1 Tax=Rhizobium leguminosarum TaxID=384 RepID=UPI001C977112|nr:hypothetical protein [Rhizobium leguminosarum]MBY5456117.1 hypothetical protein [Rhizobium leguminosarum]